MKLKNCKVGMKVRVKSLSKVAGKFWWCVGDNTYCDKIVTIDRVEDSYYTGNCTVMVNTIKDRYVWLNHKALKKVTPTFIKILKSPDPDEFVAGEVKAVYRGVTEIGNRNVNCITSNTGKRLYNLSFLDNRDTGFDAFLDDEWQRLYGLEVEVIYD